jgi:hypothetical protein
MARVFINTRDYSKSTLNPTVSALSESTVLSPMSAVSALSLSPTHKVFVRNNPIMVGSTVKTLTPIEFNKTYTTLHTRNGVSILNTNTGIGNSSYTKYKIIQNMKFKYLDSALFKNYEDTLKYLKVENERVKVISSQAAKNNDISKDSKMDLMLKADFIENKILSDRKVEYIMDKILRQANIGTFYRSLNYYDLPHNEKYVMKALNKYVLKKISDM